MMRPSAYDHVIDLSKKQLTDLLKECHSLSRMTAPANAKISIHMTRLMSCEKRRSTVGEWGDHFRNVNRAVENEILSRIVKDTW